METRDSISSSESSMTASTSSPTSRESAIAESLQNLDISSLDDAPNDLTPQSNPWLQEADTSQARPESPLQPTAVDTTFMMDLPSRHVFDSNEEVEVDREILDQFDPLRNKEEWAAKVAWEHTESHPPSTLLSQGADQATPSITAPSSSNDGASISRPSTPSFPALAAIARSFTLPRGRNARPVSVDTAATISPSTLSTFSEQQRHTRSQSQQAERPQQHPQSIMTPESSPAPRITVVREGQDKDRDQPTSFDFQKFLDQMKSKSAEPVAKYLRSFLNNFAKRTFTVGDQAKLIHDFLNFISARMQEVDIWRNGSDAEFDNALEGMEKLVMNRLYNYTFTPHVARLVPPRPVTSDDLERDRVLSQRIALFGWIEEKHLDVPEEDGSKGFLMFAEQELLKINHYKAPRDKLICILNCCKVIFGLLRHLHREEGADGFLPVLIFVVLEANPEHLLSNVEFISRFRNPTKLQSEAGYYLSSLMGAVSFIETMDHTALSNITQDEFERKVEEAIQSLPTTPHTPTLMTPSTTPPRSRPDTRPSTPLSSMHAGEESAEPLSMPTPGATLGEDARRLLQKTGDTISKPLNALGRIFSEAFDNAEDQFKSFPAPFSDNLRDSRQSLGGAPRTPIGVGDGGQQVGSYQPPIQTPYKPRVKRGASLLSEQLSSDDTPTRTNPYISQPLAAGSSPQTLPPSRVQSLILSEGASRIGSPQLDIPSMQAEIDRAHEQRTIAAKETLKQIFPSVDIEIMEWVLEANSNDLGRSIEALLEMSSGS